MKIKRYILRSLKYLLVLCVLYVALVWIMNLAEASSLSVWQVLEAHLATERGRYMIVGFVALAALYPLFGFMRSRIADCDIVEDRIRIDNAMRLFGFRPVEESAERLVYRAEGVVHRLSLMWEDSIEVRKVEGGVELRGIRRAVARVALQLKAYISNRRFEDNTNE